MLQTLLLASALCIGEAEKGPAVAMILDVTGKVTFQEAGKEKPKTARAMQFLHEGDRLTIEKEQTVIVYFVSNGQKETVVGAGQVTIARKGCTPETSVGKRESTTLPRGVVEGLRTEIREGKIGGAALRDQLKNQPEQLPRLRPLPTSLIATNKPAFSWPPNKDAEKYIVELWPAAEGKDVRRLWKQEVKEAKLTFPEKETALEPGKYRWRVLTVGKDKESKEILSYKVATFQIALEGIKTHLTALDNLAKSDRPADLLLAAVGYESLLAFDQALPLYEKLSQLQPDVAAFQLALAEYYRLGGLPDEAKKAREQAKKLGAEQP